MAEHSGVTRVGVTPIFSWKKTGEIFPLITVCHFYSFHACVTHEGCHTALYLSDLVCPLFFVNLSTIFFLRVSSPSKVSPGAIRPLPSIPLVTRLAEQHSRRPNLPCVAISERVLLLFFLISHVILHVILHVLIKFANTQCCTVDARLAQRKTDSFSVCYD